MIDNTNEEMEISMIEMPHNGVSAYSHLKDLLDVQARVKDTPDVAKYIDALFRYEITLAMLGVKSQVILAEQELEKLTPKPVNTMPGNMGKIIPIGTKKITDDDKPL